MTVILIKDDKVYYNKLKSSNGKTRRRLHLTKKQQLDIAKDINMLNEVHLLVD